MDPRLFSRSDSSSGVSLAEHVAPACSDSLSAKLETGSWTDSWTGSDSLVEARKVETGSWTIGFLVANIIVGSGIFSTPYGFVLSGWSGIPLTLLACGVCLWTALLLGDLMTEADARDKQLQMSLSEPAETADTGYNLIGKHAFGDRFSKIFGIFGFGQCFLQGVYMMTLSAHSWEASTGLSAGLMIWFNAAVCMLITLVPKEHFKFIAKVGVAITAGAMITVVASGLSLLPDRVDTNQTLVGSGLAGVSGSLAGIFLSSGDHVCFPGIYISHCGSNNKVYKKGMRRGFGLFACACLAYCSLLYLTFGTTIKVNSLTNIGLGVDGQRSGFPIWLRTAVNGVLALRVLFIIPNFMPGIFAFYDHILLRVFQQDLHTYEDSSIIFHGQLSGPKVTILLLSRVLGYCGLAVLGTFFTSFLADLINIVGSLFQSVNVIIIPSLAYLKLCNPQLPQKLLLIFVALVGVIWCVAGTTAGIIAVLGNSR